MLKRVVFFSSYWLTLAVVFLAGINRITLLSLLYVASAFIFLWKGTDFYLLPFRDIRKRWAAGSLPFVERICLLAVDLVIRLQRDRGQRFGKSD